MVGLPAGLLFGLFAPEDGFSLEVPVDAVGLCAGEGDPEDVGELEEGLFVLLVLFFISVGLTFPIPTNLIEPALNFALVVLIKIFLFSSSSQDLKPKEKSAGSEEFLRVALLRVKFS